MRPTQMYSSYELSTQTTKLKSKFVTKLWHDVRTKFELVQQLIETETDSRI